MLDLTAYLTRHAPKEPQIAIDAEPVRVNLVALKRSPHEAAHAVEDNIDDLVKTSPE